MKIMHPVIANRSVDVVIVPDNDDEAKNVPSVLLHVLTSGALVFAKDETVLYIRAADWEEAKNGFNILQ